MSSKKTILFISHDGNLAGAQLMLLRWLKALSQNTDFQFVILLKEEGVLFTEFQSLAPTKIWNKSPYRVRSSTFGPLLNPWFERYHRRTYQRRLKQWLWYQNIGLVFSNTLTNGDLLDEIKFLNCPVVTYVHELAMHLQMYTTPEALSRTIAITDFYVVCAKTAAWYLHKNHGVPIRETEWLPSLLGNLPEQPQTSPSILKQQLGILPTQQVVGGMGTADLRKGIDFFIESAQLMPDVTFLWVGATAQDFIKILNFNNLPQNIHFVQNTPLAQDYFFLMDVFLLCSRTEVYSMVAMEALFHQIPVVYFAEGGGTIELVEEDAGIKVSEFSAAALVNAITNVLTDNELRIQLGTTGFQKIINRHNDQKSLATFVEILNRFL